MLHTSPSDKVSSHKGEVSRCRFLIGSISSSISICVAPKIQVSIFSKLDTFPWSLFEVSQNSCHNIHMLLPWVMHELASILTAYAMSGLVCDK